MSKYNKDFLKELDKKLCLVPLTYDFSFKRIFANDNSIDHTILKMFLISVLKLEIDPYTCQIDILQSELPKENSKEYKKTVDINVLLNNNIHLDIEMNNKKYEKIIHRNSLYESKLFTMAFESSTKNEEFLKQYICQLNLNNYEKVKSNNIIEKLEGEDIVAFTSIKNGNIYMKNRITILKYLDYYKNLYYTKPSECEKDDLWLALLTSESFSELNNYLEQLLPDDLRELFLREAIDMSKDKFILHEWQYDKMQDLEKKEEELYYENQMKETFNQGIEQGIEKGIEQGIEKGIEQGIEQGTEKTKVDIIKEMLKEKSSYEFISKITGKSIKEIKEIEKSINID